MHPAVNRATVHLLSTTPIASCSLMATAPYYEDAVALLKRKGLEHAGVHLTLTSEYTKIGQRPVSPLEKVPSLVCPEGTFFSDFKHLENPPSLDEIRMELENQIRKVVDSGIKLTHLDGHMFFYEPSEVRNTLLIDLVRSLSEEWKVPFRSCAKDSSRHVDRVHFIWEKHPTYLSRFEYYSSMLEKLKDGTTELILHPGDSLPELNSFADAGMRRWADYHFFRTLDYSAHEIAFVGWKDLLLTF